jgi:hypothetical protein
VTLTLGATHVVSVPTVFSISQPIGLSTHLTNVPNYVPHQSGSPSEYHGIGRLNLGNSLGYQLQLPLGLLNQLFYPLPDELTLCSVNMAAGITVTVDEIVRPAAVPVLNMPWDRTPLPMAQNSVQAPAGGGTGSFWSYTVPTGRRLVLASLQVYANRINVAAPVGQCYVQVTRGGTVILQLLSQANTVGLLEHEEMGMGGLVLNPGEVLAATWNNGDTGGQRWVAALATGYTFLI